MAVDRADGAPPRGCLVARSPGLLLVKGLQRFLDYPIVFRPLGPPPADAQALIGWGLKGGSLKTRAAARRYGLPYVALEDGFLRSVSLGDTEPGLSISIDDLGVYYDAHTPSRLEQQVLGVHDPFQLARARAIAAAWRAQRVSKYNHARNCAANCRAVRAGGRPDCGRRVDPLRPGRRQELSSHARGRAGRAPRSAGAAQGAP
jgi:capsular polysaccharide export protein